MGFPFFAFCTGTRALLYMTDPIAELSDHHYVGSGGYDQEAAMRRNDVTNTAKDWARVALKLGLMLTEPKVRAEIGDQVKDRVDSVSDVIADKYEDAVERLEAAGAALRGKSSWHPGVFLLGLGVGAGLGILLAPAASGAVGRIRESVTEMPFTGTEG